MEQQEGRKYNQFRAMMAIAKASLIAIMRSPSSVVFSIVFPLIFIIVFGFIGGGGMHLKVALAPGSDVQNPIYGALVHDSSSVRLFEGDNLKEYEEDLSKGGIDGIVSIEKSDIPGHFNVHLTTSTASPEGEHFLTMILGSLADKINLSQAHIEHPTISMDTRRVEGRKFKMIDFILPGQLGFSLLSTGVFATAFVFLSLRNTLVIKRFFATPIKRIYIILGEALARLVFSLLGALIIIMIGYWVFGFTLIHGVVTVLTMLLLSAIGLIVFMGFGFAISGIAKSESSVPPFANLITLPQFLLSGTFFSVEAFPAWLQPVSKVLPLTYLNDAMRKVAFEGATLPQIGHQLLILFLWGAGIYIVAAKTFKWEN
jgi:ABC-2 type transport system permease protein